MSVSVVIPTHNRAELLQTAIKSVIASGHVALSDIIVVDDNSEDTTTSVLRAFGLTPVRGQYGNASRARNAGLDRVRTEFVAFLDDDDAWLPGNPLPQLDKLSRDGRAAFAFGMSELTDSALRRSGVQMPAMAPNGRCDVEYFWSNDVQLGAVLFRTSSLRAVGGFDEDQVLAEDTELYLRVLSQGPALQCEFVASLFRQRERNLSDANRRVGFLRYRKRINQKHREILRENGVTRSSMTFWRAERRRRGRMASDLIWDAAVLWRAGSRRSATKFLLQAAHVSPVHALVGYIRLAQGSI